MESAACAVREMQICKHASEIVVFAQLNGNAMSELRLK